MNKKLLFVGFFSLLIGTLLLSAPLTCYATEEIYVDAGHGSDQEGDGSQTNPYKTITKAVEVAKGISTEVNIYIEDGLYNSDLGEDFPLQIENVKMIGNIATPTSVKVVGECRFSSATVKGLGFYRTVDLGNDVIFANNDLPTSGGACPEKLYQ
ncbi:DUF1565 domain-containing protein [Candidatus Bipolaricaulota bacterium]|nr:DUF1565 domain-containing protein [Candidatus Bipolaricaulota bacterium]